MRKVFRLPKAVGGMSLPLPTSPALSKSTRSWPKSEGTQSGNPFVLATYSHRAVRKPSMTPCMVTSLMTMHALGGCIEWPCMTPLTIVDANGNGTLPGRSQGQRLEKSCNPLGRAIHFCCVARYVVGVTRAMAIQPLCGGVGVPQSPVPLRGPRT